LALLYSAIQYSSAVYRRLSVPDKDDRPALPPSSVIHCDVTAVSWKRILLLIVAVTVHNIPEGEEMV
jgi:hypothetical protein